MTNNLYFMSYICALIMTTVIFLLPSSVSWLLNELSSHLLSLSLGFLISLSLFLSLSLYLSIFYTNIHTHTHTDPILQWKILCFPYKIFDLASAKPQFAVWHSSVLPRHVSTAGSELFCLLCYLHTDTTKEITHSWKKMPNPSFKNTEWVIPEALFLLQTQNILITLK